MPDKTGIETAAITKFRYQLPYRLEIVLFPVRKALVQDIQRVRSNQYPYEMRAVHETVFQKKADQNF